MPDDDTARLRHRAERAEAAMQEFVSIIAHDLQEPVRGMRGFVEILLSDYVDVLDDAGREFLAGLDRQSVRLQRLIDAVVHWGRLGRDGLAVERCDLAGLVDATRAATASGGRAQVKASGAVTADAGLLAEALDHLVDNGLRFNTSDVPVVRVEAQFDGDGFKVTDNGIGIDPVHRERVTQMFARLHERDAYGGGIGAGLAYVHRIAALHGGSLSLDHAEGGGTEVTVRLRA